MILYEFISNNTVYNMYTNFGVWSKGEVLNTLDYQYSRDYQSSLIACTKLIWSKNMLYNLTYIMSITSIESFMNYCIDFVYYILFDLFNQFNKY